jgi:F-type H+-transporting ATPase subunit alpha
VGGQGHLDELPKAQVKPFEAAFHAFLEESCPDILHEITKTNDLPEPIAKRLDEAAAACKQQLLASTAAS